MARKFHIDKNNYNTLNHCCTILIERGYCQVNFIYPVLRQWVRRSFLVIEKVSKRQISQTLQRLKEKKVIKNNNGKWLMI
jgi:predicted amidophosphoribosyltransferase